MRTEAQARKALDRVMIDIAEADTRVHELRERRRAIWFEMRLIGMSVSLIGELSGVSQPIVSRETAEPARQLRDWAAALER